MYDFDLKEKSETKKKRIFPYFSLGLIIVGTIVFIGGIIYYRNTDMDRYYKGSITEVAEQIDGSRVKSVEIDMSAGEISIGRSDDGQVHLTGDVPKNYVLKETNGTLKVELLPGFTNDWFGLTTDIMDAVLLLPDAEYEKFDFSIGAGEVTIDNVRCKRADISTGAGEVVINDISCEGVLKVSTGAGEVDISDSVTGGLKLEVGAGQISYSGAVNGDIDADCGVGECDIMLTNSKEEYSKKYSVSTSVGIGEVNVSYGN